MTLLGSHSAQRKLAARHLQGMNRAVLPKQGMDVGLSEACATPAPAVGRIPNATPQSGDPCQQKLGLLAQLPPKTGRKCPELACKQRVLVLFGFFSSGSHTC